LIDEGVKHPFDWTFSTTYNGTITGPITIEPTKERIDMEKLKIKERILYYQDLTLFEDELHDNGIAVCTVKIVSC
jgi:type 2A phosphatase activator TIP41